MATTANPDAQKLSVDDYIQRTQKYAARLQQEMGAIQKARAGGLELALEDEGSDCATLRSGPLYKKLITSDYSRATSVEIKEVEALFSLEYGWRIHFRFSLSEGLPVYCRHEGWKDDPMSWAQRKYEDDLDASNPSFTRVRQNPDTLVDFYKAKGVPEKLLTELRQKLDELYREPLPEWERSMTEEEWAEELLRLQRKMEEMMSEMEREAEKEQRGRG